MGRRILFLGPPGSGKGTQAAKLATALGIPHVSTGAMLREAVAARTDLGRKAEAIMARGELVPDDLVVAMVEERLSREDAVCGYLLDGFPRNLAQAEALTDAIGDDAIETAILLEVDEGEVVDRLIKRAAEEGRADDNEETIRRRIAVYREETQPLVAAYGEKVVPVDGMGTVDEVLSKVVGALV